MLGLNSRITKILRWYVTYLSDPLHNSRTHDQYKFDAGGKEKRRREVMHCPKRYCTCSGDL